MKFSLMSDLHLDFPQKNIPFELLEKNIIVAGDTSNGLEGLKFLDKLKRKGFNVLACDGNHEHYSNISQNRVAEETASRFRERFPGNGEFEGVPVILRNGWYLVTEEELWLNIMNDSKRCLLTKEAVNNRAYMNYCSIHQKLKEWKDFQYKGIVVTHTAPCKETLDPKFEGQITNEWYHNPYMKDLIQEFSEQILVWCHGHTHAFADKIVNGVRVVCNPRGYPGENPNWKPFTIEV